MNREGYEIEPNPKPGTPEPLNPKHLRPTSETVLEASRMASRTLG